MVELKYDQHMLIDEKVIDLIVEKSELSSEDVVLEIGPGTGNITKKLSKQCKKVLCVEIDLENEKHLKQLGCENCDIIIGNALDFVDSLKFDKIVSNLPYSLCETLFKRLIKVDFKLCVFVVSKSFYDIISDKHAKLHYFMDSFSDVELVCEVQKTAFEPFSDTKSCIIAVRKKSGVSLFDQAVNSFFKQDDKLLKNALMNVLWNELHKTKKEAKKIVEELSINPEVLKANSGLVSNDNFLDIAAKLNELTDAKKDIPPKL
jgi:16S rRNA (adenine1518-N6/adenine1519-N6)-dimethyltransferase